MFAPNLVIFLVAVWIKLQRVDAVNCGDIITNSTGWFSSPDISGNGEYEFGAECVWVIRVPDNKILHIQFDEIDIEEGLLCSYDWLRIRDGNTKVAHYCGKMVPPDFVSQARLVFVEFHSDFYINKRGFNATFTQMDDPTCGFRTWSIADKFGSMNTELHEDCTWIISQQKHIEAIQVYIAKMDIPESKECEQYFLEISNGETVLERFCGSGPVPMVTAVSITLYVRLRSPRNSNSEFMAYYCTTDKTGELGGIRAEMTGLISSPDQDNSGFYDHNSNVVWSIVAAEGFVIQLDFLLIHIESGFNFCKGDTLSIFDGAFEPGTEKRQICGYNPPQEVFLSETEVVYLRFISDSTNTGAGFNITYTQTRTDEVLKTTPIPSGKTDDKLFTEDVESTTTDDMVRTDTSAGSVIGTGHGGLQNESTRVTTEKGDQTPVTTDKGDQTPVTTDKGDQTPATTDKGDQTPVTTKQEQTPTVVTSTLAGEGSSGMTTSMNSTASHDIANNRWSKSLFVYANTIVTLYICTDVFELIS